MSRRKCRKCVVCGKVKPWRYYSGTPRRVVCSDECFTKEFWDHYVKVKDNPYIIRVKGKHYFIEDDTIDAEERFFRGFGGIKFSIKKFTGEIIETRNLWCQGEIPTEYRGRLPDNAEFVSTEVASDEFIFGEIGCSESMKGGLVFCTEENCSF